MTERDTAAWRAADRRALWHPFTQMALWQVEDAPVIARAEGGTLIDTDGRRYLDGISSLWANVFGHRVAAIDEALRAQLDRVAHTTLLGLASVASIEAAEALLAAVPKGLTRVFFSDSGSEAVEVAIKMAFQYWRQNGRPERRRFLAFGGAYHGDTVGGVSVGGIELFHATYGGLLFPALRAPEPYCYRCPLGLARPGCALACAAEAEALIARHAGELAAVVIEPEVQGAAGMILQPPGYLARIAAACRAHDVFLICDEVATGFGRTGKMFAVEHGGITPDFMCLAKGLTGGYLPLSATVTSERVYEGFLGEFGSRRTFFHGHTYTGNPLACAAAKAALELFRTTDILAAAQARAAELAALLEPLRAHPHVGEIRQRGLMVGIELVADKATREPYPFAERRGHRAVLAARERGVVIRPLGDVIVLMPPLSMPAAELQAVVAATAAGIEAAVA